jgi:pyruvate dehydrogenase E1 component beta subunit
MANFGMDGRIQATEAQPEKLNYGRAIREATAEAMRRRPEVVVFGEGITDSGAVFGSTAGLLEEFGSRRIVETPLSENALTGICTGAAIAGLRPILVHQRIDFSLLGMDQLVNHAAKWSYMYDGRLRVPFVLRCIVGKGWGQAAQHSQSLQAMFAHVPGLKVVMPASPADAAGLLLGALEESCPVVFIEGRPLYPLQGPVALKPEKLGEAKVLRPGKDLTVIGCSWLMPEILKAAEMVGPGINAEVIDLRSISPIDGATLTESAKRTRRVLVVDTAWRSFGISAEISALIHERCFGGLLKPVARLALPNVPTPCSPQLEKFFYPDANRIATQMRELCL